MGCHHNLTWKILSFVFLVILSATQQRSMAQGRANLKPVSFSKTARGEEGSTSMSKMVWRGRIGSRPPRCDRRCSWCGNCEAIQVPTNPQAQTGKKRSPSTLANLNNDRGDDYSNYKPMSWKCKCGNFIFNP